MKNDLFVIIDSELGESDSFRGVFSDLELAKKEADTQDMFFFERTIFRVSLNEFDRVDTVVWEKRKTAV